jgi:hypothetical protein
MTFIKRMLGLCGLTTALVLASGCSDYTYFNVGVYLSQQDDNMIDSKILQSMTSCKVAVFIGDKQIERPIEVTTANGVNGICKPGFNGEMAVVDNKRVMKLGVLDYSSARQSGRLDFWITVRTPASDKEEVIAQGDASENVSSGKVLEVPLIVYACATADHPKGKTDCRDIN